nr:reverse transcriptase domain-containing protein [Tanacetum cinerariifolium]
NDKALLSNKEKLLELANIPFNENCSAVILKKLPEKLRDPEKFLISCGFSELKCKALANLELLSNDSLLLPKNESFHFDIPSSSRPPAKPPDDDSGILNFKVMGDTFEQYVPMPRLLTTQPNPASNQEKSPHLLSHRGIKASQLSSKSLMMIYGGNTPILDVLFLHFYPP